MTDLLSPGKSFPSREALGLTLRMRDFLVSSQRYACESSTPDVDSDGIALLSRSRSLSLARAHARYEALAGRYYVRLTQ